jgi:hypothetical protein
MRRMEDWHRAWLDGLPRVYFAGCVTHAINLTITTANAGLSLE